MANRSDLPEDLVLPGSGRKPAELSWPVMQESAGGSIICPDVPGIAGLLDTVAGSVPERLTSLLEVLWTSDMRTEAWVVVLLASQCRDPLSSLAECCRQSLKTASDLDRLASATHWQKPSAVCIQPRANALLNLCRGRLQNRDGSKSPKLEHYRAMVPRLEAAAELEYDKHRSEIKRLAIIGARAIPDLLSVYSKYASRNLMGTQDHDNTMTEKQEWQGSRVPLRESGVRKSADGRSSSLSSGIASGDRAPDSFLNRQSSVERPR